MLNRVTVLLNRSLLARLTQRNLTLGSSHRSLLATKLESIAILREKFNPSSSNNNSRRIYSFSSPQSVRYLKKETSIRQDYSTGSKGTMPPIGENTSIASYVNDLITNNKVVIFAKTTCPWCAKVKALFKSIDQEFISIEIDLVENGEEIKAYLIEQTNQTTVPNVFINGKHLGGYDKTEKARQEGTLAKLLNPAKSYVEDLIKSQKIVIFSKTTCPWCAKVKALFKSLDQEFTIVELDVVENGEEIKSYLAEKTNQTTVPNVFMYGNHIGGYDKTEKARQEGTLAKLLNPEVVLQTTVQPKAGETTEAFVTELIKDHKVVIFSKTTCPFCAKVKELFKSLNEPVTVVELDQIEEGPNIRDYLFERTGQKTVPNVYVTGVHLGGSDNTLNAHVEGRLAKLLHPAGAAEAEKESEETYDYDMVVIGGGSGGLACSKAAAELGAKVAVLDFVKPTPIGTTWGLGGTCVNVGCIPKKLMHQSALLGESLHDSKEFGWKTPDGITHDWATMKDNIQAHIGSLNFNYRVQLRDKKVDYLNAYGTFLDRHRLTTTNKAGKVKEISAKYIVVATGGRPKYPEDIKGAKENTITSDDLFSLPYCPGKTLCVGASYVSLECAGFLKGIGLDVTVMVRSILLRGFDQQMANLIGEYMENKAGVKFIRGSVPFEITRIKEGEPGELLVKYKNENGETLEEVYNTVLLAVGRDPCTNEIGLDKVGVKLNSKNKKIATTFEQTNISNIYGIGDCIDESSANNRVLELTPVAIKAGQLLARRLFGASDIKMDYNAVPTTVFTPLEYGNIGFSEEEAIEALGAENVEIYHVNYWPLEWTVAHKPHDVCYAKLICNKLDKERVIGFHVAGPNAGEITQGYAVAIKLRATKKDFDMTVGIHPTCSETFTTLTITKNSGKDIGGAGC